jgi:FixJ family two-component response regulator
MLVVKRVLYSRALRGGVQPVRSVLEPSLSERSLISIVDDDQAFRDSLRRLLKSFGYAVEAFPSASDFLSSPKRTATACLVADIHMLSMTGIDLYRHLIRQEQPIPTILVTAYPDDRVREQMLAEGVEAYLYKPLDEVSLMDCLRSAFARGSGIH